MEGPPNKGISPKKGFSGHKLPNSGAKESNENDCSGQNHMSSKMQNPKKPIAKHFMSPTISASSKAVPRNKILGERNGIPPSPDTHLPGSPVFGSKTDFSGNVSSKITVSKSFELESHDDEKISMVAYDPSSSYLSPRPKYLRFNPNRKYEEIDFQNVLDEDVSSEGESPVNTENEENKMNPCLNVIISDALDSEQLKEDCKDKVEEDDKDEGQEESEDEVEQYEEVKGCSLKGTMRFLVLLFILVLAASFMFSMDSTVLNSDDVTADPNYSFNSIQEHILEDLYMCMLKDEYGTYMGEVKLDFEEEMMESGHEQVKIIETQIEWNGEAMDDELPEQFSDQLGVAANAVSATSINGTEMEMEADWIEDLQPLEDDQQIAAAKSENVDSINNGEVEIEGEWNEDVQPLEGELQGINEQSGMPNYEVVSVGLGVEHECGEELTQSTELVEDQDPMVRADMVESKVISEIPIVDTMEAIEMRLMQPKNEGTAPIVIGIICALFSMISGSLFFISSSKGNKSSEGGPHLVSKIVPIEKHVLTEVPCTVTPKKEEKKIVKLAESCPAASSFDYSAEDYSQIRGPTVQLLGELVVREVERSLRICDQKGGAKLVESEDSNNIQEIKKNSVFQISSCPQVIDIPESSSAVSPSCYGSFTTETKILKKEKGKDAEFTTPVRRSSRIRSKSVTSP